MVKRLRILLLVIISLVLWRLILVPVKSQISIEKWSKYTVTISNPSDCGATETDKFRMYFDGVFTHAASGTQLTIPGYYAGDNNFKIDFMPTLTGTWTYTTVSSKPEGTPSEYQTCASLANQTGDISVISSNLPGFLGMDPNNPKKWKFSDGPYVVPVSLRVDHFMDPATQTEFDSAADVMQTNNAHIMETRLFNQYRDRLEGRNDFVFQIVGGQSQWQQSLFDTTVWDTFNLRQEALAQRGLGSHIMIYVDTPIPAWPAQSFTEDLVIRYTVARTAAHPVTLYNTGVDIDEYRTAEDVDYMGNKLAQYDPYNHPRSSRHGIYLMNNQNFDSDVFTVAKASVFIDRFNNNPPPNDNPPPSDVPISPTGMDDAWGENRASHPAKNHTEHDIRRAFWKATIAGGVGGMIRGGATAGCYNGYFCLANFAEEWESEQWIKFINPFIKDYLGDTFGQMVPTTAVVSGNNKVWAIADPTRSKILYFHPGGQDKYDLNTNNSFDIVLTGLSETYIGNWFDTCNGTLNSAGSFSGGQTHSVTIPAARSCTGGANPGNHNDWVLLLTNTGSPIPTPTPTPTPSATPTPTPTPTPPGGFTLPDTVDWTNRGIAISEGVDGEWDRYLWGGFANSIIKKGNTYYLYYQGSPSYDNTCESVTQRAIGVATSPDGINWTKYSGNPIITWSAQGSVEEGAVSSGVWLGSGGKVYMYYGANTGSGCNVSASGRLALSSDGLSFTDRGEVLSPVAPLWGAGDEVFPVGAYSYNNIWYTFYTPNGVSQARKLGVAWGTRANLFTSSAGVNNGNVGVWGTVSVVLNGATSYAFVNENPDNFPDLPIKAYSFSSSSPTNLTLEKSYVFADCDRASVLYESDINRWLMLCRDKNASLNYLIKTVE